jgi:Protein of unknown function (DUF1566)
MKTPTSLVALGVSAVLFGLSFAGCKKHGGSGGGSGGGNGGSQDMTSGAAEPEESAGGLSAGDGGESSDGGSSGAAVDEDGNAGTGGEVGGSCSGTVCTDDYPCRPLGASYTCRGQFADWPPAYSSGVFIDITSGTLRDSRSGLVWQRVLPATYAGCTQKSSVIGDVCTWQEAKAYCAELELSGTGWRLPTEAELEAIIDDTRYNPAIDPIAFPETPPSDFWSASPLADHVGSAWFVSFQDGLSIRQEVVYGRHVRCVR